MGINILVINFISRIHLVTMVAGRRLIGNNWNAAVSMLKQEYKEDETSLQDALDLSIKVLSKTLDMTKLTPEKIELATLTRENGKTQIKILPANQVDELIKKYEKVEAELEAAKKEKEKAQSQSI